MAMHIQKLAQGDAGLLSAIARLVEANDRSAASSPRESGHDGAMPPGAGRRSRPDAFESQPGGFLGEAIAQLTKSLADANGAGKTTAPADALTGSAARRIVTAAGRGLARAVAHSRHGLPRSHASRRLRSGRLAPVPPMRRRDMASGAPESAGLLDGMVARLGAAMGAAAGNQIQGAAPLAQAVAGRAFRGLRSGQGNGQPLPAGLPRFGDAQSPSAPGRPGMDNLGESLANHLLAKFDDAFRTIRQALAELAESLAGLRDREKDDAKQAGDSGAFLGPERARRDIVERNEWWFRRR